MATIASITLVSYTHLLQNLEIKNLYLTIFQNVIFAGRLNFYAYQVKDFSLWSILSEFCKKSFFASTAARTPITT